MFLRIRSFTLFIILLLVLYLLFWPIPVNPEKWVPPAAPALEGDYAVNTKLSNFTLTSTGAYHGPEDVAIDSLGNVYGGVVEGKILRWNKGQGDPEVFADTKGRPLGLHFDKKGNLIVADADKGLLSVSPEGVVNELVAEADGVPFLFTDDLEIAKDGKIYFSDASSRWTVGDYVLDLMEQKPYGRLMVYDPEAKTTKVLMDGLYFANGIALSKNNDFVLVNETGRYRITRYWLSGPEKGRHDIFIDNLPGFPDGVSSNEDGVFWVAIPSVRKPSVDKMHKYPFLKKILLRFPRSLHPKPVRYGFVLGLNESAEVVYNLQDPSGAFSQCSSVQQFGDEIFLGSLVEPAFARLKITE